MKKIDSSLIFKNGAKFKRIDNNYCVVYFWVFYCPFFIIVTYKILRCKSHNQLQKNGIGTSCRNGHGKFDNSNKHVIFLTRQP